MLSLVIIIIKCCKGVVIKFCLIVHIKFVGACSLKFLLLTVFQLINFLRDKLQGGFYFALQHAFTSFDPQGRGTVAREALYRLLSNFLSNAITPSQFSELLMRLSLDEKKIISFEEFFSKFHTTSENKSHWLDLVIRQNSKRLSAEQVHNLLKERARQK